MNRAPVLFACLLACVLLAFGPQQAPSVDALSISPARLRSLKEECRAGRRDSALCAQVAQADLRRFLSGQAGPDEYTTLADLPAIPPSFDEPAVESQTVSGSVQEPLP
ncbi:hypothetical protein ABK836_17155 [Enterobacter hormaechei]|uniref:hypothetical protein n=1 Tax=Enterobacter hormaechei TaxID=158836 RepID=UPI0037524783